MTTVTTCPTCHGRKRFWRLLFGFLPWPTVCPTCEGWGRLQPYAPQSSRPGQPSYRSTPSWRQAPGPGPHPLVVDPYAGHSTQAPQAVSPEPEDPDQEEEDPDSPDSDDSDADKSATDGSATGDPDASNSGTAY